MTYRYVLWLPLAALWVLRGACNWRGRWVSGASYAREHLDPKAFRSYCRREAVGSFLAGAGFACWAFSLWEAGLALLVVGLLVSVRNYMRKKLL